MGKEACEYQCKHVSSFSLLLHTCHSWKLRKFEIAMSVNGTPFHARLNLYLFSGIHSERVRKHLSDNLGLGIRLKIRARLVVSKHSLHQGFNLPNQLDQTKSQCILSLCTDAQIRKCKIKTLFTLRILQ